MSYVLLNAITGDFRDNQNMVGGVLYHLSNTYTIDKLSVNEFCALVDTTKDHYKDYDDLARFLFGYYKFLLEKYIICIYSETKWPNNKPNIDDLAIMLNYIIQNYQMKLDMSRLRELRDYDINNIIIKINRFIKQKKEYDNIINDMKRYNSTNLIQVELQKKNVLNLNNTTKVIESMTEYYSREKNRLQSYIDKEYITLDKLFAINL